MAGRPSWIVALGSRVPGRALRASFHWGVALVVGVAAAFGVYSWSTTESKRFPPQGVDPGSVWVVPGWGQCAKEEYRSLLADAAILGGVVGFFAARCAEQLTSD